MALLVDGQAFLGGMGLCRRSCCERPGQGRQGKCSGALNWVSRRRDKKMAELPRGPGSSYFSDNADTNRLGLVACGKLVGGRGGVERTGTCFIVVPVLETVPIVPVHFLSNPSRIGLVALRGSERTSTFSIVAPFLETAPIVPVHFLSNSGRIGMVALRGKHQRWGPSCSRHPLWMLWPSGWMTKTACLEKTIQQPRLAKGPKPMRVWGKVGITCPCTVVGGRDAAEASVALATNCTGRPFATRTPTEGAVRLRLATGALDAK